MRCVWRVVERRDDGRHLVRCARRGCRSAMYCADPARCHAECGAAVGLAARGASLAAACLRHARDWFRRRPAAEVARVLAICRECERYDAAADTCKVCTCKIGGRPGWIAKTRMRSEGCPIGKW